MRHMGCTGQQIAYDDMCKLVGDLFINRWLDNKHQQDEFQIIIGDYKRQIDELMKEREGLIAQISVKDCETDK